MGLSFARHRLVGRPVFTFCLLAGLMACPVLAQNDEGGGEQECVPDQHTERADTGNDSAAAAAASPHQDAAGPCCNPCGPDRGVPGWREPNWIIAFAGIAS